MIEEQARTEPLLVSKKIAAQALGVCIRTVETLLANKQLPFRKIGRRVLIPYRALQEFARSNHATNAPAREVSQ